MYYCYVMYLKSVLMFVYDFSSPGFSWDAVLKMTGIKLEMINDMIFICLLRRE